MEIFGHSLDRADLRRWVGNMRQAGGVQLVSYQEGHERGVRILEFDTGSGFRPAIDAFEESLAYGAAQKGGR